MSANYRDLLKYAATGIASPSMTYYDKMRASTLMGAVQTLTGQPPISFKADGSPLISWSMKGNGQQTGTPSPDNIIMPTFCGVRTANVMPAGEKKTVKSEGITFESDGNGRYRIHGTSTAYASVRFYLASGFTTPISVSNNGKGTLSIFNTGANANVSIVFYNGTTIVDEWVMSKQNRTSTAYNAIGNKYVDNVTISVRSGETVDMIIAPEFTNDGVLPNEFEPYGYKIPLTCASVTTPIYLGEVSTVRRIKKLVFDGTEGWAANTSGENTFRARLDLSQANVNSQDGYCSHLPFVASGISQDIPLAGCYNSGAFLRFDRTMVNNITEFKTYLQQQYAAGTPVTVWYVLAEPETGIVNEPLCKIGDYADELSSEDASVTIPTVKGSNVLTVETELQPSEMSITYRG